MEVVDGSCGQEDEPEDDEVSSKLEGKKITTEKTSQLTSAMLISSINFK